MSNKVAIVSLSDKKYFHLLEDLINSIRVFKESKKYDICILDAGMTNDQVRSIKKKVNKISKAKWDIKVNPLKVRGREWLKSQVSRPFIPKYFPKYKKYIWIDCDAWINSWFAIDLLNLASKNGKLAICSMADRHAGKIFTVKWLFRNLGLIKSQNYKHSASSGFSIKHSQYLATQPHLNVGVFALEKKSKLWKAWQKNLKKALGKGRIFGSEQIALNFSIYIEGYEADILPYYCNWIPNERNTIWDTKKKIFLEKYTPNHKIGIVHLAGGYFLNNKDMRFDKSLKIEIGTLQNKRVKKSFRFSMHEN